MRIEQQVTSLDLAKMLKELGVAQESLFYFDTGYPGNPLISSAEDDFSREGWYISAFTFSEIWEMLPKYVPGFGHLVLQGEGSGTYIYYADHMEDPYIGHMGNQNLANFAARLMIYLIGQKLWQA